MVKSSSQPFRQSAPWTDEQYSTLVDMVREGYSVRQLERHLGRTGGGIQGACGRLLPKDRSLIPTEDRPRNDHARLRAVLCGDDDYDWRAALHHRTPGVPHWTPERTEFLTQGWEQRWGMDRIARSTDASEEAVYSQLVALGLASSVREVVDRVGCEIPGTLHRRSLDAKERAASSLWILHVTGLNTRAAGAGPHLSLHPSPEHAEWTLSHLLFGHYAKSSGACEDLVSATLAQRLPDGQPHGEVSDLATTIPLEQPTPLPPRSSVRRTRRNLFGRIVRRER